MPRLVRPRVVTPWLGILLATLAGCQAKPAEDVLLPVAGKITVDGRPLPKGWVMFYPDPDKGNNSPRIPYAEVGPDGSYALATNSKPGAPAGAYRVVVVATVEPIPIRTPPEWRPTWLHAEKYAKQETTDLRIEVVESPSPGQYDLHLSR